jgi:hypothetical protein
MTQRRGRFIAIAIIAFGAGALARLAALPALGQTQNNDGPPWCGTAWACDTVGLTGKMTQGKFAGFAFGGDPGTSGMGVATGQASADAAEKLARSKCAANNGNKSCIVSKTTAGCFGLAVAPNGELVSTTLDDPKTTRVAAWFDIQNACIKGGDAGCRVHATACAGDDPRAEPPFPLPPELKGGKVDPAVVGIWEFPMNPGRWVWEIGANGNYQFHTEAPDNAPSHAGTFVANDGTWTLLASAGSAGFVDQDGGTYLMQGPDTMVMTGKYGAGAWQRIKPAAPAAPVKK